MGSFSRVAFVILVGLALVGCDLVNSIGNESLSVEESESDQAVEHGIEIFLETPDEVRQHHPFQIEYHLVNHRAEDVTITTGNSCLAWIRVQDGGEPAGIKGMAHGCYTAITGHHIASGDTATQVLRGRAEFTDSGEPAEAGMYQVTAESDVFEVAGEPAGLPTVEGHFIVRE